MLLDHRDLNRDLAVFAGDPLVGDCPPDQMAP